jgi:hypothetical protein
MDSGSSSGVIEQGEQVGECPECGFVHGEDVSLNFPNEPMCSCGEELLRATVAEREVVL